MNNDDREALEYLAQEIYDTPYEQLTDQQKAETEEELAYRDSLGWRSPRTGITAPVLLRVMSDKDLEELYLKVCHERSRRFTKETVKRLFR